MEEEDAWGYVEDDDYDDGYGNDTGAQAAAQEQQDDRTTDDFLSDAVRNLIETEELGEEGLRMLAEQREVLGNVKKNVDRMGNALDEGDRLISEMETPWGVGNRTKHSGSRNGYSEDFGEGLTNFNMEGEVHKRGRSMKQWNPRYFKMAGNTIEYSATKGAKVKIIDLAGAELIRLSYGEKDSNGVEVDKDNCFEIKRAGRKTGDTIHIESSADYRTWCGCIWRAIRKEAAIARGEDPDAATATPSPRKGVGFGNAKQDALLDTIMDKLDNVDGIARTMGAEVDDQNHIIDGLNNDMERLNNRVDVAKERVKAID